MPDNTLPRINSKYSVNKTKEQKFSTSKIETLLRRLKEIPNKNFIKLDKISLKALKDEINNKAKIYPENHRKTLINKRSELYIRRCSNNGTINWKNVAEFLIIDAKLNKLTINKLNEQLLSCL